MSVANAPRFMSSTAASRAQSSSLEPLAPSPIPTSSPYKSAVNPISKRERFVASAGRRLSRLNISSRKGGYPTAPPTKGISIGAPFNAVHEAGHSQFAKSNPNLQSKVDLNMSSYASQSSGPTEKPLPIPPGPFINSTLPAVLDRSSADATEKSICRSLSIEFNEEWPSLFPSNPKPADKCTGSTFHNSIGSYKPLSSTNLPQFENQDLKDDAQNILVSDADKSTVHKITKSWIPHIRPHPASRGSGTKKTLHEVVVQATSRLRPHHIRQSNNPSSERPHISTDELQNSRLPVAITILCPPDAPNAALNPDQCPSSPVASDISTPIGYRSRPLSLKRPKTGPKVIISDDADMLLLGKTVANSNNDPHVFEADGKAVAQHFRRPPRPSNRKSVSSSDEIEFQGPPIIGSNDVLREQRREEGLAELARFVEIATMAAEDARRAAARAERSRLVVSEAVTACVALVERMASLSG